MRRERVHIERTLDSGRFLYEKAKRTGHAPLTKRAVPTALPHERRGTQGACLYACAHGHVWIVFMVRSEGTFRPLEPSDVFCEDDPCAAADDEVALGAKVSGLRHWTMR